MKNLWFSIPSRFRRGVAYMLMAIGMAMIIFWSLNAVFNFLDLASKGWVDQLDGQVAYVRQASFRQ